MDSLMTKKKDNSHYVDKEQFHLELVKYKKICDEAKAKNMPNPPIPDSICKMFIAICNGMARRPNFSGYTYIDEMILDGIENCLTAIHHYDPSNSKKNPFGYFSRCVFFAFIRRIQKEKKQTYIKYKSYENFLIESCLNDEHNVFSSFDITNDKMNPILEKYEKRPKKTKKKKKKSNIEFLVDENEEFFET